MTDHYYHLLSNDSVWSVDEARFVAGAPPDAAITDLPDLDELRKCLRFYNFKLGGLAGPEDRAAEIRAELAALDAEYLTPRVLAGLATGDSYALARLAAHQKGAVPLRRELMHLTDEIR